MEQIYKNGKTYDDAVKITAKKLELYEGTIRHYCTADIGLSANQLRKILKDKEKLKQLLIKKFPEYESLIRETIM